MSLRLAPALALLATGCAPAVGDDLPDSGDEADLAGGGVDAAARDLASAPRDLANVPPADLAMAGLPKGGNVGPGGGAVDRLYFAVHGDTRPMNCNDTAGYPTMIIQNIYKREAAANVEFAVDVGDHMFVCSGTLAQAQAQMKLYTAAAALLPKTTFF